MATHISTIPSAHSVEITIARVERAVLDRGMKVFARIDQAAEAAAVGLQLPPTVLLVFGSPRAGTPIMAAYPTRPPRWTCRRQRAARGSRGRIRLRASRAIREDSGRDPSSMTSR